MKKTALFLAISAMGTGSAFAAGFVNGGFDDGTISGWVAGGGNAAVSSRSSVQTSNLDPAAWLPGGLHYNSLNSNSSIIANGTVDPRVGALLGSTTYGGTAFSYRVENTSNGGYASAVGQTVLNYTDPNIFFAWKAVLQNGGHVEEQSAAMVLTLTDLTTNTVLVSRTYNAGNGGGGVDPNFNSLGSIFYTPSWQIEQVSIDSSLSGHDFSIAVLAADCSPTGHYGYVYLDGFGNVAPPPSVPEPASLALLAAGLFGLGAVRRRKAA